LIICIIAFYWALSIDSIAKHVGLYLPSRLIHPSIYLFLLICVRRPGSRLDWILLDSSDYSKHVSLSSLINLVSQVHLLACPIFCHHRHCSILRVLTRNAQHIVVYSMYLHIFVYNEMHTVVKNYMCYVINLMVVEWQQFATVNHLQLLPMPVYLCNCWF